MRRKCGRAVQLAAFGVVQACITRSGTIYSIPSFRHDTLRIMSDTLTNPTPQFGTAEYAGNSPGAERCTSCGQSIGSQYYRLNGAVTCNYCGEQAQLQRPKDSQQTFVRGLLFGIGGAILGLVIYAGFGIVTGLMLGYISLAVGYIVGKSIMKGTSGIGGRRYQIAAVALTYAAVSLSAIPIGISQIIQERKETKPVTAKQQAEPDPIAAPSASMQLSVSPEPDVTSTVPEADTQLPPKALRPGAAIGALLFAGRASPFLELQDPMHGAIGLIILFVGLRIAWQLTAEKKLDLLGPFPKSSSDKSDAGS